MRDRLQALLSGLQQMIKTNADYVRQLAADPETSKTWERGFHEGAENAYRVAATYIAAILEDYPNAP